MIPTVEQLADAQSAINAQHPSLSGCRGAADGGWTNECDGNGRRILRVTAEQLLTITRALGVATGLGLEARSPAPTQIGWTAIIDAGLMARGAAGVASESLRALERVDVATLERMAVLVLGDRAELGPDTPESVAAKAGAGRTAFNAFREMGER